MTGIAGTGRVNWAIIVLIPRIAEFEIAKAGKEPAIAGITGRHHTIEHINP